MRLVALVALLAAGWTSVTNVEQVLEPDGGGSLASMRPGEAGTDAALDAARGAADAGESLDAPTVTQDATGLDVAAPDAGAPHDAASSPPEAAVDPLAACLASCNGCCSADAGCQAGGASPDWLACGFIGQLCTPCPGPPQFMCQSCPGAVGCNGHLGATCVLMP